MKSEIAELLETLPDEEDALALPLLSADPDRRPVPTGRAARLWTLGTLQARVAAAYALCRAKELFTSREEGERLRREAHTRVAMRLLDGMGYLRGAILKVGQALASYPDVAPDSFVEILGTLHFEAPPMHFSLLREQVRRDLGEEPEEAFASFDERAFAAASLGQVHRARLRTGERVAVKIQYPGIARAIESDLLNARMLLGPLRFLQEWESLAATLENVSAALLRETDYRREADVAEEVREALSGMDDVLVPRVHRTASGERVLTTDLLPGTHLPAFLAGNPSQEERDRRGAQVVRVVARLYYSRRTVLADPNPGNFLFLPDGRLGVIDFGCFQKFADEDWEAVLAMMRDYRVGGQASVRSLALCTGGKESDFEDPERLAFHRTLSDWVMEPVLRDGPFDFGDPEFLRRGFALLRQATERRYIRQRPVFLWQSRCFFGLRGLLHALGARVDERRIDDEEIAAAGILPGVPGPGRLGGRARE